VRLPTRRPRCDFLQSLGDSPDVMHVVTPLGCLFALPVLILVLVITFAGEGRRKDALEGLRILLRSGPTKRRD
jgi:hypothetical protein